MRSSKPSRSQRRGPAGPGLAAALRPALPVADALVPRRRLVGLLEAETPAHAIALIAPSGYGKSTLLMEWARSDPRTFAWIDLCEADNEPGRLQRRLHAAVEQLRDGERLAVVGQPTMAQRRKRPPAAAQPRARGRSGSDEDANPGRGGVLVLDGLERLHSEDAAATVRQLLGAAPRSLTVAIASRAQPAGLGALRMRPGLLELGPRELAMSAVETRSVLAIAGVTLGDSGLEALAARCEGWPAAIHLAALALRSSVGVQDTPEAGLSVAGEGLANATPSVGAQLAPDLRPSAGEHNAIAQFVREQTLGEVSPEALVLLRRCAVLERLSGEACDAVLDGAGAGRTLRELASAGTLLFPEDEGRTTFRCHPLLRDVLRADLAVCEPAERARLHRRASAWHASCGEVELAVGHAVQARDAGAAGKLLWEHAGQFLYGRDRELRALLRGLGSEELERSPQLVAIAAHCHLALGELQEARRLAHRGGELLETAPGGGAAAVCAVSEALMLIDLAEGPRGAQTPAALRSLDAAVPRAGALAPLHGLLVGVSLHLNGEHDAAVEPLERAVEQCAGTLPLVEALSAAQLGLVHIERGDAVLAEQWTASAVETLAARGLTAEAPAALAHAAAGLASSLVGFADTAKGEALAASRALDRLPGFLQWYELETTLAVARTHTRLAEAQPARALLTRASRAARRREPPPHVVTCLDAAWGEIDALGAASLSGREALTMAELRVLRFLPTHLSFREIGDRLHVSSNTVKTQAHAIYTKLKAGSRSEAVARAAELGLIEPAVT